MNERRTTAARQKSLLQGRIYFNNRRSSIDCLIRDISATGAKLRFSSAVETPAFVELHIPNKDETHPARVAWRRGEEMGVEFVAPRALDSQFASRDSDSDLSRRVQKLEEEISAIGAALVELRAELKRLRG